MIYSARRSIFSLYTKGDLKVIPNRAAALSSSDRLSLLERQQWDRTVDARAVLQGDPLSPRAQCREERDPRASINARSVEEARGWAAR